MSAIRAAIENTFVARVVRSPPMRRLAAEYILMGVIVTVVTGFAAGALAAVFLSDAKFLPAVAALIWGPAAVIGTAAALRVRRTDERQARARSHCIACGYDLRSSPDRCPECGLRRIGGGVRWGGSG